MKTLALVILALAMSMTHAVKIVPLDVAGQQVGAEDMGSINLVEVEKVNRNVERQVHCAKGFLTLGLTFLRRRNRAGCFGKE